MARLLVRDELVQGLGWHLPSGLRRSSGHFALDDQVAIARALRERERLFSSWIGSLPPSRRAEVFTRALEDLDTSNRIWPPDLLDVLPHRARHAEARRILQLRMLRDGTGWAEATNLVAGLAGRADDPAHDAGPERDRPSAQRLHAVLETMAELPWLERSEHRADLLRVAGLVGAAPDELTVRLAAIDWTSPTAALAAVALRLDDHPLLLSGVLSTLGHILDRDEAPWDLHTFDDAIDHLIGLGSAGTGAMALELVESVADRFGWPDSCRTHLRALRSHPVADVALLAARLWTEQE